MAVAAFFSFSFFFFERLSSRFQDIRDMCPFLETNAMHKDLERMLSEESSSIEINSSVLRSQLDWISFLENVLIIASKQVTFHC